MLSGLDMNHDIAARFDEPADQDALFDALEAELRRLGFGSYIYAQMHVDRQGVRSGYANRSNTDPQMRATYARERVFEADPLIEHCLASRGVALWSDLLDTSRLSEQSPRYRRMAELAEGYGLHGGVSFRQSERPLGAGTLLSGFSLMADAGIKAGEHDSLVRAAFDELHSLFLHFGAAVDPGDVSRRFHDLASRELEVLQLTAEGLQIQQVADRLSLADRTVAHHLGNVRQKLNARTNAQAVAIAIRTGIL